MIHDILVVDDEADIRQLVSGVLQDEGYETRLAATSQDALEAIQTRSPSLVILDVWLHGSHMDGLEFLEYLKSVDPVLPVIIISGHGNIETAMAAIRRGAYDFLEKPFKTDKLLLTVERAIEASYLKRENTALKSQVTDSETWVGSSPTAQSLRASIEKLAPTNSRVLIEGKAGVGKELVARLIHKASQRAGAPFIIFNAAGLTPAQIDIALFGQEEESGTPQQLGLFEKAHNGTLLLDDVSELPPSTQGKILRFLIEQQFQRVGGHKPVQVDVRVLSSTTRNLQQEIDRKRLREDLYYRLNVVPIYVPDLAERSEDISDLVTYFSNRISSSSGLQARPFSEAAIAVFQSREWPGNIRQLRNIVERIMILSPGDATNPISVSELPQESQLSDEESPFSSPSELITLSLKNARERFERQYLAVQIKRFNGNISRTAKFIGMERSALHRKLKALGLQSSYVNRE